MHPSAAKALCSQLKKPDVGLIPLCANLCCLLEQLPSTQRKGQLYEKVIAWAFACRCASLDGNSLPLKEFLGLHSSQSTGDVFQRPVMCGVPTYKEIERFPRAAEKKGDQYHNRGCSKMPSPQAAPWFTIFSDPFNCAIDAMVCVPCKTGKPIAVGIQCKQHKEPLDNGSLNEMMKKIVVQFAWKSADVARHVKQFLEANEFVLMCVVPSLSSVFKHPLEPLQGVDVGSTSYNFGVAVVTHDDIRCAWHQRAVVLKAVQNIRIKGERNYAACFFVKPREVRMR
jgi:hypothetical protein